MRKNYFVITLSPELVVEKEDGKLRRNADGSQFISVIPDGWLPNEGEVLYITFSREDSDTEQDVKVGPLQMCYNAKKHTFVTLAPHDLICFAGQWDYSLELRFNISEDEKGELVYDCLTSSRERLTVMDSIVEATKLDTYTKESELIGAAKTIADALTVGYTAQDVIDAANSANTSKEAAMRFMELAEQSALNAKRTVDEQEQQLLDIVADGQRYAYEAEQSAYRAEKASETSTQKAADAAESALLAEQAKHEAANHAQAAAQSVNIAWGWAGEADTQRREAGEYALRAAASAQSAKEQAELAARLLEQFASYGIKINTDYSSFDELPVPGDVKSIYLIPNGGGSQNCYDEWIWVEKKNTYEKIGSTEIDLSSFLTKSEAAETYATKEEAAHAGVYYYKVISPQYVSFNDGDTIPISLINIPDGVRNPQVGDYIMSFKNAYMGQIMAVEEGPLPLFELGNVIKLKGEDAIGGLFEIPYNLRDLQSNSEGVDFIIDNIEKIKKGAYFDAYGTNITFDSISDGSNGITLVFKDSSISSGDQTITYTVDIDKTTKNVYISRDVISGADFTQNDELIVGSFIQDGSFIGGNSDLEASQANEGKVVGVKNGKFAMVEAGGAPVTHNITIVTGTGAVFTTIVNNSNEEFEEDTVLKFLEDMNYPATGIIDGNAVITVGYYGGDYISITYLTPDGDTDGIDTVVRRVFDMVKS